MAAGVHALPAGRAATGSALVNSVRQIASTIGVAVLVTVLAAHSGDVTGYRIGWTIGAVLSLATAAIGALLSRPLPVRAAVPVPAG